VVDKIPVKFLYDETTPSALGEFTSQDTVSVSNGGTGVSSLADLGIILATTNVSALSVSATTISSPTFTGGAFTGTSVSSTTLTSPTITGASVSATALSATTITGAASMPIPAPWAYAHIATAGTASDTEQNIGVGSVVGDQQNSTDDFEWDDTNKRWDIKKAGTYEITANVILTAAATTDVTLQIYTTSPGSAPYSAITRIHSAIDPRSTTITYIGTIAASGYAYVTTLDDGATDVTVEIGTTITVKRLL